MNEMSVKGHDLSEMCRLCLTKDSTLLDIFCFSDEMRNELSNLVMRLAPVQIKRHDEMPNSICRLCYAQLKNIHKFQMQIVQSDKTLRQYLQQLNTSDQQVEPECSIQKSSEKHLTQKTNHSDVTEKYESNVYHDIFGMNLAMNEVAPFNYNSANKLNEEMSLKFEIKDEPTEHIFLNQTECADNTVETLIKVDSSEMVCEDTKVDINYDTQLDENVYINGKEINFKSTNKMNQKMPSRFAIKDEPTDDNSSNQTECSDDRKEIFTKSDSSQICGENPMINSGHIPGNNVSECLNKSEEGLKDISINYEKQKDTTEQKYYCDICNKSFIKYFTLKTHVRIHTTENSHQCDVCNKFFRQKKALNYHKRTHTGVKPYKCDVCNMCFNVPSKLLRHARKHTGEKPYQCEVCNKCFSQLISLKIHTRTHTGEKPYQCDVCNMCFSESGTLNTHKRTHTGEKPYQCDVCNKRFSELGNLNLHKRTHTGEKPYQCDVCNKNFSISSQLITHKRIHTGEKPYQCENCTKCFSQLISLKIHERIHTGEKPYQCDVCNMCFTGSSGLTSHKRIHTGEKPYQCDFCNKCFSSSASFNKHNRTHTGEKPYQCDICNKGFSQSCNLNRHKQTHTGEKSFK